MKNLKTIAMLLVVVVIFGGAMLAVNLYTGPIIEANNAGAAGARLNAVMPEGNNAFENITATLTLPEKFVNPANANRTAEIVAVHKETNNGAGYVVEVAWTSEDSHGSEPNLVLVGISTDGKIINVFNESYHDTDAYNIFAKDPNYAPGFVGKDSALADIGTVSGSTHSSDSFRSAVAHAFEVLVLNDMVVAGVKSDEQILLEMIPSLHTGLVAGGTLKAEKLAGSGNIIDGYKALNGSGYAFIASSGEAKLLVLVNNAGACKVVDVNGADVTADNAALCTEALAVAAKNDYSADANRMILAAFSDATEITSKEFYSFGNVVYAASFKSGETSYTAFFSRPLTYEDSPMAICTIIDENGAIAAQRILQMAFGHGVDYMSGIKDYVNTASPEYKAYLDKFGGITESTLSDSLLISGATVSSTAVKNATADAFAAYNSMTEGGAQ